MIGTGAEPPDRLALVAERIGSGHAYDRHVVVQREYPVGLTRRQFIELILKVLRNPDEIKPLQNGRQAFWRQSSGTVVLVDPSHPDGGTAFRPSGGLAYFHRLR